LVVGHPGDRRQESDPRVLLRADRLEMHRGDRVALLGPNGSGKTTLLRTLMDELKPLQGQPRLRATKCRLATTPRATTC
jgi:ATP-binding cassette subfamily F protein 3